MTAAVAATIVCAAACLALVYAEWSARGKLRAGSKLIASLGFLAVGVSAGAGQPWFLAGLALGLVGDLALLGHSKRAFIAGLGAFLLGHIAYVVAIALVVPPQAWLQPLDAVPIAVAAAALAVLWPRAGSLRGPVIAYVVTIVAMMIGALAARDNTPLVAGAALFFASDLAVARDRFIVKAFANKAWGLPAYYAGQLLIAWSLAR
jgi:uncharacterized membrane protein YhhN